MKQYTFDELVEIIETLRSENGCPWDKVQTHESLRPCMMEEAAELLGAIRIYKETGNAENMQEELGDILLQAVMHSVIAKEEGLFTIEDVISGISEKMIRRHPHVFGNSDIHGNEALLQNWEEIKKQEKAEKSWVDSPLREIPPELPSLTRAVKIAKKLDKLPEYHDAQTGESRIPDYEALSDELTEATGETKRLLQLLHAREEVDKQELAVYITRLLRTICQISYRAGLQPEQLLFDDIEAIISQTE
ncbi:MAG: MazG family protein [Lachnospiraceae bacterium]|nr:MazG family protein [Lachnospiraceae bacterium]